jgi:hypothetical protein
MSAIPRRVLPGDCQERFIVVHFYQTQFNKPRDLIFVDHPRALCSNILLRPSEVDRIKTKLRKWIFAIFHSYFLLSGRARPDGGWLRSD